MADLEIRGGCACGAIRFECSSGPLAMLDCHCRDCQRASGGACSSLVIVATAALRITGEPRWYETRADSGALVRRGFCATCGSPLFASSEKTSEVTAVKVGSLDDPRGFAPIAQIWTASAQPWALFHDRVPKLPKNPPGV
jgi:hypothetical protein